MASRYDGDGTHLDFAGRKYMNVLIAPDKFKDCLSAGAVVEAIAGGVRQRWPDARVDTCPMADGGERTVVAMVQATGGRFVTRRVTGPLPEMKVDATFGLLADGRTAVIEMASASGLHLLPVSHRNPLHTTTFGTGELLKFAAEMGCTRIVVGIGGSATTDAGIGCLQACGCHIVLQDGSYAPPTEPLCGRDLPEVLAIKSHRGGALDAVDIVIASDVTNPLYGPDGAALVYGPQKGASTNEVRWLDTELRRLAERTGHVDIARQSGAGAAGGLGFGLSAFLSARLHSGAALVADAVGLVDRIGKADLVFTGEGRVDCTSVAGKVVGYIDNLCRAQFRPLIVVCGAADAQVRALLHARILALTDIADEQYAKAHASALITRLLAEAALT